MGKIRVYPYIKPLIGALYLHHWKTKPVIHSINSIGVQMTTKLNKSQQRDIAKTLVNGASLGKDYMARGLSALYRSAMKTSQQNEIMAIALAYGVVSSPEFIV
jgi:hypothetical protein